ncbi:hypothetical protein COLO4_27989 [Corchorus olitorius]|uniref:SPX domain-containing protein n=1 Tax=Corchorus olitorius TaxID=93759 RepID=A0A1R3HNM8_9ROSI|nr:hypothetical protein COLO4_27989 [Corchorus olitorius]
MEFGKSFKRQMVSEWTEAYVDYDGLKSILQQILHYKLSKQPETHLRSLNKKLSLHRTLSGLHLHHGNEGDVEDQVKEVDKLQKDDSGSGHEFYKTKSLGESGEGGEIEVEFFRKLDEELNKVNTFYKEKVEEVMDEAALLNKQMDALIALRFKVQSSVGNGACLKKHPSADILNTSDVAEMGFNESISEVEMSGKSSLEESSNSHNGSGNMGENLQGNDQDEEESASDPEFNPLHNIQQSNSNQKAGNNSASQQNPLEVLERVKITNTLDSPMSTIKGIFKDSKHDELCFEKTEVKKVEERLREVFIEFYQKLRLLKHFRS